ncbi:uncharacterized protein KY384_007287 [Bacidia gigantensis]|uniref:uncharacterized protein n=1 Tax=Bacidia gigantensis TaxID=2732470 RepID=UPI001D0535C5|nr:uncharacterized protein KY384_007287 [Bacidia gigantensis]KAG8528369.1 hypothetical protein KY384_007287 [Bacidia gigantensis]
MAPCLEDDGYGYGGTVNVSSVGLKIAEAPKDDDDWTKANFELDVWHTVTFQDEGFLKLAHVKVPDDVGGKDWVCENPGYGGKRVVRCGVKIDGEFPQDALPTYPVHVEQPLALAPPGFVGDAL